MKTTVVPAQITTVEDKIAGSLNFIQIMLLIASLILGATIYGVIPPRIHLTTFKLVLIVLQFSLLGGLALRIKGKILAEWLTIIFKFLARPRIYIYSKKDLSQRTILTPKRLTPNDNSMTKSHNIDDSEERNQKMNDEYFDDSNVSISVKPGKKGGLDVSLHEI